MHVMHTSKCILIGSRHVIEKIINNKKLSVSRFYLLFIKVSSIIWNDTLEKSKKILNFISKVKKFSNNTLQIDSFDGLFKVFAVLKEYL